MTKNYITESAYIQPVIVLCFFEFCLNGKIGYGWGLKYVIQCTTYCVNTGNINYYMPEGPINIKDIGAITFNNGSTITFHNLLFNLTMDVTLNSEKERTKAHILIECVNCKQVYYNSTYDLKCPTPDKQAWIDVEDPLYENCYTFTPFPVLPSDMYKLFQFACAIAYCGSTIVMHIPLSNHGYIAIMTYDAVHITYCPYYSPNGGWPAIGVKRG